MTPSSSSFEAEYAVYKFYQTAIHGDTDDRCTREQFIRFLVNSPLRVSFLYFTYWIRFLCKVSLVKTGTEEFSQTFTAGASLYAKYQIAVHNDSPDECDVEQYLEFLVDSPLQVSFAGVINLLRLKLHEMCIGQLV